MPEIPTTSALPFPRIEILSPALTSFEVSVQTSQLSDTAPFVINSADFVLESQKHTAEMLSKRIELTFMLIS